MSGDLEAMALYAGQSAGLTDEPDPAGEIVADLAAETAETVGRLGDIAAGPLADPA